MRNKITLEYTILIVFSLVAFVPSCVLAEEEPKVVVTSKDSTSLKENGSNPKPVNNKGVDISKELHNPLASLTEIFFQMDVLPNVGPDKKNMWSLSVEPLFPFDLGNDWKLVTYTIVPLISEPAMTPGSDRTNGIGDTNFFGYFVPPNEGALSWGFGPALQIPTHTDDDLGNNKWAAGPAVIIGADPGKWSIWGLFDNIWSFAGPGEKINEFTFQYQVVYMLPEDWFVLTNWIIEADWEADSDNQWTVPLGGGFGKQFKIGEDQYQLYGQVGYNVVAPDEASTWRGIVTLTKVF